MYYNGELIKTILEKTKLENIVEKVVELKDRKKVLWGLCPFHKETAPSFTVNPKDQTYYCYGCGRGGNAISFIMDMRKCSFHEAVKELGESVGIEVPEPEYDLDEKLKRVKLFEIYEEATLYYQNLLCEGNAKGYKYLTETRRLTDETIRKFRLGLSDKYGKSLYSYLKVKGYEDEFIFASGLVSVDVATNAEGEKMKIFDKFWSRIMFPIIDHYGKVIGFGGRVLNKNDKPKYINSSESNIFCKGHNLYGLNFAANSAAKEIVLCEGNIDVISMHQAGFDSAVASLGTALTNVQAKLLRNYTDSVCIAYDSDDAGKKAAVRAISILQNAGLSVRVADVSPFKDVDELILSEGASVMQERLNNAVQGDVFLARSLADELKNTSSEEYYDKIIDLII